MKTKITILFCLIIMAFTVTAQQGINYKAIIDDADGNLLANTAITVQFTILENGTTLVYSETHNTTTDANGILIVNIGEGSSTNDFSAIDWSGDPLYLKTEIDKGEGLVDMGTTEFKTVPYALYAKTSGMALQNIYTAGTGITITNNVISISPSSSGSECLLCQHLLKVLIDSESYSTWLSAGIPIATLVEAGAKLDGLFNAGISVQDFLDAGYTISELFYGQLNTMYLFESGVKVAELQAYGITLLEIFNGSSLETLYDLGYAFSDLLNEGMDIVTLVHRGASYNDFLENGIGLTELLNAGADVDDLFDSGVPISEFEANGISIRDLFEEGVHEEGFYGTEYAGGIIFYIDSEEGFGLIFNPETLSDGFMPWGNCIVYDAEESDIGYGITNTWSIYGYCGESSAASICIQYFSGNYSDWFLPSKEELEEIYQNIYHFGLLEPFSSCDFFWSSTQADEFKAFGVDIFDGGTEDRDKTEEASVVAVREFRFD